MSVQNILLEAFFRSANIYSRQMNVFYPAIGDDGIHEFNQVKTYLQAINEVCGSADVCSWMELSFLKNKRLDGAFYLSKEKALVLIEAKRIKQGKQKGTGRLNSELALASISENAKRLLEIDRIQSVVDRVKNIECRPESISVYWLLLADIWLNDEPHMKKAYDMWLDGSGLPTEWHGGIFLSTEAVYNDSYKLLIAVHPNISNYVINNA